MSPAIANRGALLENSPMDLALVTLEYSQLRLATVPLHSSLAKQLSSADIGKAASDLGILHGKYIDLETEDESAVLMDYAIHDIRHDGLNAVDRMLRDAPPPEASVEMRLLRSMQRAFFTTFTADRTEPGIGVYGTEEPARTPCFIADIGFSKTAVPGASLVARLHSPGEGWHMSTGAALPVVPEAVDGITQDLEAYLRDHGDQPTGADLSSLILRNCIAAGASRSIRYAQIDSEDAASVIPPTRSSPRIGRNEPCPCGSGKKFKKCCGR